MVAYHGMRHSIDRCTVDSESVDSAVRPLASTKRVSTAADADGVPIVKKTAARMAAERTNAASLRAIVL
jgi:hypothetical protein